MPGETEQMSLVPDQGEHSYRGSGKLSGKKAVITGADTGIGRAVAIAYAREGADVLIAYLSYRSTRKLGLLIRRRSISVFGCGCA